jgi:hypothetical protein
MTNDIRSIKAPVEIPDLWFWVLLAGAIVVFAGFLWLLWRRRQTKKQAPVPEVVEPPHQKARRKLEESLALLSQPREFCILVSDTTRVYIEERFSLRAPERTTEEFMDDLRSSAMLTSAQKKSLADFLRSCDLAKFARYEPAETELRGLYEAAVRLVSETEPPPQLGEQIAPPHTATR